MMNDLKRKKAQNHMTLRIHIWKHFIRVCEKPKLAVTLRIDLKCPNVNSSQFIEFGMANSMDT